MLRELKRWLKRPGNSNAKLAYLMGYKSGSTIANWVSRKSIPNHVLPQLKRIIK
jgi:hypothetical protein